ncbi:MAG: type II toxin-antitoxin system RelE/ParE family toxin [Xanthomonadales bacterium]|nr:type II toxin-antitoxin system RelE/ParE family toxin [Xanthomonadales bacterium]
MKPAIRSERAEQDIRLTLAHYLDISPATALTFLDALERAADHIETHPGSGSPRYAHELAIPQLRYWMLDGYPHALFYIEHADHLDVIRFAHLQQDIPTSLREPSK